MVRYTGLTEEQFLSTPSARRATGSLLRVISKFLIFLSTPSARRATYHALHDSNDSIKISIHALREEGDTSQQKCMK